MIFDIMISDEGVATIRIYEDGKEWLAWENDEMDDSDVKKYSQNYLASFIRPSDIDDNDTISTSRPQGSDIDENIIELECIRGKRMIIDGKLRVPTVKNFIKKIIDI